MSGHADAYLALLERLSPDNLDALDAHVADQVRFRDPFNDVAGRVALKHVFERMFEDVENLRFTIVRRAVAGDVWLLAWTFEATIRRSGGRLAFDGMSEIHLAPDGRVAAHIDHWDAAGAFYERLPVLGAVLRRIRKRLGVGPGERPAAGSP